jgi:glycerol-3-phosphate acyltransferase PlsY
MTRVSSVGALTAAAVSTIWMFLIAQFDTVLVGIVMTLLLYWRHRQNLARLRAGTEPKIGQKP